MSAVGSVTVALAALLPVLGSNDAAVMVAVSEKLAVVAGTLTFTCAVWLTPGLTVPREQWTVPVEPTAGPVQEPSLDEALTNVVPPIASLTTTPSAGAGPASEMVIVQVSRLVAGLKVPCARLTATSAFAASGAQSGSKSSPELVVRGV